MLKKGSLVLSIWCIINFLLALIILSYVIILKKNSPILQVASFTEIEIASLGAKTIAALNAFTILYNSCSLVISVLTWPLDPKKPDRRAKISLLDVSLCDRLCGSDGVFGFLIYWAWSLAGERSSVRSLPGGHWPIRISNY